MKNPHSEFLLLRDRLKSVASFIVSKDESDVREAMFLIGCMHTLCCNNVEYYQECKADLHD